MLLAAIFRKCVPYCGKFSAGRWLPRSASCRRPKPPVSAIRPLLTTARCESFPGSYNRSSLSGFENDAPLLELWHDNTPIESTHTFDNGLLLLVKWADGETQTYPAVWLRDNCHCEQCFQKVTFTRNAYIFDLPLEGGVQSASVIDDGRVLSVIWSDGHLGDFPTNWLRGHRFDQSKPDPIEDVEPILWDANVAKTPHFRVFEFDDVMQNDESFYDWLSQLHRLGLVLMKNAPQTQSQVYTLQKRLGYVAPSPTSVGIVDQNTRKDRDDHPSYTPAGLQLHTDMAFYTEPKGFSQFHCLQQVSGDGGDSLLADGFKAASDLKERNPEAFEILSTVKWEYKLAYEDNNYHLGRHKIISVNEAGKVDKIVINDILRSSMFRVSVDDVLKSYSALKKFSKCLYDPTNLFCYKLQPGDILAFHNHRLVHGRRGYSLDDQSKRHLVIAYSDWETVSARMRTLKKQQLLNDLPDADHYGAHV